MLKNLNFYCCYLLFESIVVIFLFVSNISESHLVLLKCVKNDPFYTESLCKSLFVYVASF